MDNRKFDLEEPDELMIHNRLLKYFESNKSYEEASKLIARDFPYLGARLKDCVDHMLFEHYHISKSGIPNTNLVGIELFTSNNAHEPFATHGGSQFLINSSQDIIVGICVSNPQYTFGPAESRYCVYLDGKKVISFDHTLPSSERTAVYKVPLELMHYDAMKGAANKKFKVTVEDENRPGLSYEREFDLFVSDDEPCGGFMTYYGGVYRKEVGLITEVINIEDEIKTVHYKAEIKVTDEFKHLDVIEGRVLVRKCHSDEEIYTLSRPVKFVRNPEEPEYHILDTPLFNCAEEDILTTPSSDSALPTYILEADELYTVTLVVFGEVIWQNTLNVVLGSESDLKEMSWDGCDEDEMENEDEERAAAEEAESIEKEDMEDSGLTSDDFDQLLEDFITQMGLEKQSEGEVKEEEEAGDSKEEKVHIDSPDDYIQIESLHLFSSSVSSTDYNILLSALQSMPHTIFAEKDLDNLVAVCRYRKRKDFYEIYEEVPPAWHLYDQTGRFVDSARCQIDEINDVKYLYGGFDKSAVGGWQLGTYRIELKWGEHSLLSAVFKVSELSLQSEYDIDQIKRKSTVVAAGSDGSALAKFDRMLGMEKVKEKVHSLVNSAKLQKQREAAGLPTKKPALHARFLGNPGTGKTTVARLIGEIYKEMGLLSSGHVVIEERKNLIGRYYDSEGLAVDNALNRAKGGILFIDEAYNLYVEDDPKDPGKRILEYLLTALSNEDDRDWMLILAGYPEEMERMLNSNPGIKSRVSEEFIFEDFDIDTLVGIGEKYCDDNNYELSEEAKAMLKGVITREYSMKDKHFGNGRYVNKLMEKCINVNMATRLSKMESPTREQLITIEAEDIVSDKAEAKRISVGGFDEDAIDEALKRLDSMVGLNKVKSAIHNFVNISRYLNSQGEKFTGKGLLKWNFTGNTGTGKSTVAQILADILKAMNLIQNSDVTEVKGEEIFNVSDYTCNETLKEAVKKTRKGMLLIDGDAPEFRSNEYRLTNEQVRFKLATLASEDQTTGALVISECSSPKLSIAHSLANNGIYDYDHIFIFDDYTDKELYEILTQCLEKYKVTMAADAESIIRTYIGNLCQNRDLGFANARTMKNLSRAIFEAVLLRLSGAGKDTSEGSHERVALACDVDSFVWNSVKNKIGY